MKKIVYIEDDPDIATVIEMALGDIYQLMVLMDAHEIAEKISHFMPDLILIDNYIGLKKAADVIKEIKQADKLKDVPFILCSGSSDIHTLAQEMSANAYLEKPFELADLYTIIKKVFDGHIS
ncbi:response regulator [Pedobacter sp. L105]|uniref:response regulator n=1 Tax=Pedobacter sp. L105 TaxID=1641871 RepID=UPI00131A8C24|nr:response regulator [Pedobacter sp. L105]